MLIYVHYYFRLSKISKEIFVTVKNIFYRPNDFPNGIETIWKYRRQYSNNIAK